MYKIGLRIKPLHSHQCFAIGLHIQLLHGDIRE